jgi:hypothetical protein
MARRYLIDKILPARQVHLIGGASGAGKTRFTCWWQRDWIASKPVFGFDSHPEPTMYFANDRNDESLDETLSQLGALDLFPWKSLIYEPNKTIPEIVLEHPHIKVFIFDPIMNFIPGCRFNDYGAVSRFLTGLTALCFKKDITILGMVHTTKVNTLTNFTNPREKLLGSAAWGGYSETLMIFGCIDPADTNPRKPRFTLILPRNHQEFRIDWRFDATGMPEITEGTPEEQDREPLFQAIIPEAQILSRAELLKLAVSIGISGGTFDRVLKRAIDQKTGYLESVRHGHYRKPKPC